MISFGMGMIVTAVIFYTSILYKSTSLAVAGCAAAALPLLACLFLMYRLHTIRFRIQAPVSIAECGRPLTVRIYVENESFLACPGFKCLLECRSSFLSKKRRMWMRGQAALPGENCYDYKAVFSDYGSYVLRLKKVRVYDLTGLFYLNKTIKSNASISIQVFPNMQEIGVHVTEAARNFFGDSDIYDDFRPGNDSSELFQIRPFQNGDKIQRVHWKLSAKMDELLVKDDSMPKACPVVFLLDYKSGRQRSAPKANAYLVVLASISFSLVDAGCAHYMAWYSGVRQDVVRLRVDDEESLYVFLSCYLEETFPRQGGNLLEDYKEKYRGESFLHVLQFDEQLELTKNQDKIAAFSVKNWKEQLKELELIL